MNICRICRKKKVELIPLRVEDDLKVCRDCYRLYREINNTLSELDNALVKLLSNSNICKYIEDKNTIIEVTGFDSVRTVLRDMYFEVICKKVNEFDGFVIDDETKDFIRLKEFPKIIFELMLMNGDTNKHLLKIKLYSIEIARIVISRKPMPKTA